MSFDGVLAAGTGRRELRIGLLCAALLLAIWSSYTLLSRFGVKTNFPAADLMLLRVGVGGLIMMPWFLRIGLAGLSVGQVLFMALTAGIGFSASSYIAFSFAPAAHASVLQTATLPLNTAIFAVLVLGERFRRTKLLGLGLIVLGVVLMGYESLWAGEPGQWRGDVLFYFASLCWAVYSVFAQRWGVTPLQAAAIVYAVSALMYLPVYAVFFHPHFAEAPTGELVLQVILQGVLANLVSIFAFTRIVQAFGASSTAMLTAASPVVVALAAIPLLGEVPTALGWAGLASVVSGIIATMLVLETRRA
jgi:drug/metabolite transporter (DMT)-like permease